VVTSRDISPSEPPLRPMIFLKGRLRERSMSLIAVFAVLMVIGQAVNVIIAMQVERFSEPLSLVVFFVLLVLAIIVAWKLALRLTEPRDTREQTNQNVSRAT
jgi:membrane protein implicated in regulation of membrane protease activity